MATRRLQFGEVGEQGDVPVRKEQEVIVEEATRCNLGMQQDVAENQGIQGGVSNERRMNIDEGIHTPHAWSMTEG